MTRPYVPDDYDTPDEFDERRHEHDEPDEGDGFGAINWPVMALVFYAACYGIGKLAGVI